MKKQTLETPYHYQRELDFGNFQDDQLEGVPIDKLFPENEVNKLANLESYNSMFKFFLRAHGRSGFQPLDKSGWKPLLP